MSDFYTTIGIETKEEYEELMAFNFIIECTCCNKRTNCNEEIAIVNGQQKMMNFCKDCYEEIKEIKEYYSK